MQIFSFFTATWIIKFENDKTGFICMASAASYYFTCTKDAEGRGEVKQSIMWAYTKHFGSLALGSLILTMIAMLRTLADSNEDGGSPT